MSLPVSVRQEAERIQDGKQDPGQDDYSKFFCLQVNLLPLHGMVDSNFGRIQT